MSKISLGILDGGGDYLIGIVHRIASQMFDRYKIVLGKTDKQKKVILQKYISRSELIGIKRDFDL